LNTGLFHHGLVSTEARPAAVPPEGGRRYDASGRRRRAEENRVLVLEAATRLFSERGWAVGMRDVAAGAGVSVETVYAHFGSKVELLNQVLDVAVVGDDRPVALMERPEFAALGRGDVAARVAAAASLVTAINRRTAGLQRALREAAATDQSLAARLEETRGRQRLTVQVGGSMIAGRELAQDDADGLSALLSMEVYELLTGSAGWSPAKYEKWLAGSLTRQLGLIG
jgi:AcrR family transcriptional regulator